MIHGSPGSIEDWSAVLDELAGSFRVTAFDRPGHGFSGDTGEYSCARDAEMALAVIDALALRDVVVVGHSYGGSTALATALRAPAKVASYVILDSAAYRPGREPTFTLRLLAIPGLGLGFARAAVSSVAPSQIREGIVAQFDGRPPPRGFVELRTRIWATPKVTHAIARETLGAGTELPEQSRRYGTIRAKVHVLAQAESAIRSEMAQRFHREIEGSTLELLSGTGHYLQVERPDEVVAAVRRAADAGGSNP